MRQSISLRALFVAGASVIAITTVAAPAFAQEATMIEELVVTAEKREASLQDVPVAITAFTSERRDILGVNTVEDLARMTPSVSYTNNDRMSIRGFGRLTNAIGTDPSVALYSDGVFTNSMSDASTPSLFIERTEVLRGPQGTLYGRNSIGGALNIIAKSPTEDFNGEVRVSGGSYGAWSTQALVRGPINDHVRVLFGGSLERRDEGFIHNDGPGGDTGGLKRYLLEAQLEADLSENINARIRLSKFDWDDSYGVGNTLNAAITPVDATSITGAGGAALYYNSDFGYAGPYPAAHDPFKLSANRTTTGKLSDHYRIQGYLTWQLPGATLKYLGGVQSYVYDTTGDGDNTGRTALFSVPAVSPFGAFTATGVSPDAGLHYQERQRWSSNELNLSSATDSPLQWIVGIYQYQQRYDQPQGLGVGGDSAMLAPVSLATGGPAAPNPSGDYVSVNGHLDTKSYAVFGQIDWHFAEEWKLTAGLRYTKDKKSGFDYARYVSRSPTTATILAAAGVPLAVGQGLAVDLTTLVACGGATIASCAANPLTADLKASPQGGLTRDLAGDWDAVTGTLGVQWEPDDDTNAYLRYSRGYKAGGWYGAGGLVSSPYAEPEYVDSFELGLKKNFGRRVQINGALYYAPYSGMQTPLTVILNPTTGTTGTRFLNLDALAWGLELEGQWAPIDNLNVFANFAYINAKVTKGCCYLDVTDPTAVEPGASPVGAAGPGGTRVQDLKGNRLPLSPETKVTLGANYTWQLASGSLMFGGNVTHTAELQSQIFANPIYTAGANDIADVRMIWKAPNNITVIASVKNAFDKVSYLSSTPNPPAITAVGVRRQVLLNFPRTYGIELQYKF